MLISRKNLEEKKKKAVELWGMIHDFTEYLPAGNTKDTLQIILSDDKDFSKFNHFINSSSVANQWYEFRRKACERYVYRILEESMESKD